MNTSFDIYELNNAVMDAAETMGLNLTNIDVRM
jgi:hypothetical protein